MNKTIIILFFIFLPLISLNQNKLLPQNEIYKDSSLTDFICKLQYAVFKKDKDYLISVIDKNIKFSFDENNGIDGFKKYWNLDSLNSQIWFYLSKLISMGGTFSNFKLDSISSLSFVFPYVFNMELPNDTLDYFSVMAIIAKNVHVREKPDKSSKSLGQLTYDIVTVNYDKSFPTVIEEKIEGIKYYSEKEWYFISTLDKKINGFVYWDYIWSPIDYRLFLNKINGQWKITCLIYGD